MKLHIDTLTTLLAITVILLAGCSVLGIITGQDATDPVNQLDFGPVSEDSRIPFELPPYPEPSFEGVIAQFKADVAANKGYNLTAKKRAISKPELLWTPAFYVPDIVEINFFNSGHHPDFWKRYTRSKYDHNKVMFHAYHPHDNMVLFLKHDYRGAPVLLRGNDVRGNDVSGVPYPFYMEGFRGKIFYTTKRQEKSSKTCQGQIWMLQVWTITNKNGRYLLRE